MSQLASDWFSLGILSPNWALDWGTLEFGWETTLPTNNSVDITLAFPPPRFLFSIFTGSIVFSVYIQPRSDKQPATKPIIDVYDEMQSQHSGVFTIITGDFNRTPVLPITSASKTVNLTKIFTRGNVMLDYVPCTNHKRYKIKKLAPLSASDHNMLFLKTESVPQLAPQNTTSYRIKRTPVGHSAMATYLSKIDWDHALLDKPQPDDMAITVCFILAVGMDQCYHTV